MQYRLIWDKNFDIGYFFVIVLNSELNALNVDAMNVDTERPVLSLYDAGADVSSTWGVVLEMCWVVFMRCVEVDLGLITFGEVFKLVRRGLNNDVDVALGFEVPKEYLE